MSDILGFKIGWDQLIDDRAHPRGVVLAGGLKINSLQSYIDESI